MSQPIQLSVLDWSSPDATAELAPAAERLGYARYWVTEHHADSAHSPAPFVILAAVGALTNNIRIGTAGILLRYTSPVAVVEHFRVLNHLFPERLDLGLARGDVVEPVKTELLDGRPKTYTPEDHEQRIARVATLLIRGRAGSSEPDPIEKVLTPPLEADEVSPSLWVLGSSIDSASLAARLGACYAYSDLFARERSGEAIARYRNEFTPCREQAEPEVCVSVAGLCSTSSRELGRYDASVGAGPSRHIVGGPELWDDQLTRLAGLYGTNEFAIHSPVRFEVDEQLRSYHLLADTFSLIPR